MRLFLALAVLMLALIAYTEAQAQEETVEAKFVKFTEQMNAMSQDLLERSRTAWENFQNSDTVTNARNTANEYLEKIKNAFTSPSQ